MFFTFYPGGFIWKHRLPVSPRIIALFILSLSIISCKKGSDGPVEPGPDPDPTNAVPYYKLQRVENLPAAADDSNPTEARLEILYSLKYKKEQPVSYAKTNKWDFSLSGLYNSFLGGNNKSNTSNSGYQGPGVGGIMIVDKKFDEVTAIPADASFATGKGMIGTDDAGYFGQGTGWYLYDFGGTLAGDGSYDKMHVAYALGDTLRMTNGSKLNPRTILLRTATGDYAKIKMISCYKDTWSPDQWFRTTPHMYFTFEYVIVPAGSTQFEIR